jgi:hypothetical protein
MSTLLSELISNFSGSFLSNDVILLYKYPKFCEIFDIIAKTSFKKAKHNRTSGATAVRRTVQIAGQKPDSRTGRVPLFNTIRQKY